MANKIITFNNEEKTLFKDTEIFKDISLISKCTVVGRYYNTYDFLLDVTNITPYSSIDTGLLNVNHVNVNDETHVVGLSVTTKPPHYTKKLVSYASSSSRKSPAVWKIEKLTNLKSIFNSLHNIFHWIPGERIINPEFGSKLYYLLYNGITPFTTEQIISEIKNSVSIWEPRVNISLIINASSVNDTENNTIRLDILFTVPKLDENKYVYSYIQNTNK